jgi:hypothetical protein
MGKSVYKMFFKAKGSQDTNRESIEVENSRDRNKKSRNNDEISD